MKMEGLTVREAICKIIEGKIEAIERYQKALRWWQLICKAKCRIFVKDHKKLLEMFKLDAVKLNSPYRPENHSDLVELLSSPYTFDV